METESPAAQALVDPLNDPRAAAAMRGVGAMLALAGADPASPGLAETPRRVVKAFLEMVAGRVECPETILGRTFDEPCDELIVVRGVEFVSLCEHHLLPFSGTADVGYLPGKVVGLSKLARLVDCFARRLQMQERLTRQIADAIASALQARGVGVVIRAKHSCLGCRGAKKPGAEMVTSVMMGALREKAEARAEFLALCQSARAS